MSEAESGSKPTDHGGGKASKDEFSCGGNARTAECFGAAAQKEKAELNADLEVLAYKKKRTSKVFEIPYVVPSLRNEPLLPTNQIPEETSIMEQAEIQNNTTEKLDNNISNMGSQRFERFSDWNKLVDTIARLQHIAESNQGKGHCHHGRGLHLCRDSLNPVNSRSAERNIIKAVQAETYNEELLSCVEGKNIPANSSLVSLNPFVDQEGILRVGGRLSHADIGINEQHPIIISGKHHIATLLIRKLHHQVKHQGRLITNGAQNWWLFDLIWFLVF
ncbi:unnamed protein product [Mytilus coruscus]|uniref:Uncharacterized protein n=1 Tax=Mytilus coruscus TaxID=42192 RepID=A0A6J8CQN6_MYTCO|nr:unnamed protein product [Mytilus coruscus]